MNSRIAWADSRDNIRFARFNARVLVSSEDQDDLGTGKLLKAPVMAPGDLQLPAGDGMAPPVQETFDNMLPDLPSFTDDSEA